MLGGTNDFEHFLEIQHYFIETSVLMIQETFRSVYPIMFPNLHLSARSDVARLEKIVVSLEERVYTLEDALISFANGDLDLSIDQIGEEQAENLEREESGLGSPEILSSIPQRPGALDDLTEHLKQVEDKLDRLLAALEKPKGNAVSFYGEHEAVP